MHWHIYPLLCTASVVHPWYQQLYLNVVMAGVTRYLIFPLSFIEISSQNQARCLPAAILSRSTMPALPAAPLIADLKSPQLVPLASKPTARMPYMPMNPRQTCVILTIVTGLANRILGEHGNPPSKRSCPG